MMTKLTGTLTRVFDDEIRIEIGPFEYQVLVTDAVRRQLQLRTGQEITLHILEYLEGNSGGNRFIPRKLGFNTQVELDFFELFCTVEKIGVKKALKAMCRPVKDIADAIARQDAKWLSTLPGIGATTAEQIITTLKRKIAPYTVASAEATEAPAESTAVSAEPLAKEKKTRKAAEPVPVAVTQPSGQLIEDVYLALQGLGLTPVEAREKLDRLLQVGQKFQSVGEALAVVFAKG